MTADHTSADGLALGAAADGSLGEGATRAGAADRRSAAAALPERITFIGFGLIGGSIARALRDAGSASRLTAWSPNGRGPAEGLRAGIVDNAPAQLTTALDGAGLVILAGPPLSVLEALDGIADARRTGVLPPDATITDVASTKGAIVARAADLELPFVGGHPMAGRELSGLEAAEADLFVDRPWVVVPARRARDADVVRATALARATGARPVQLTAEAHDRAVAAISHLPLVLSAALVATVAAAPGWSVARELAAGGWAGMTRLAHGDPEMGAGILATNAPAVADSLRALTATLDGWVAALDGLDAAPVEAGAPGAEALRARLSAARDAVAPTESQ